MYLRAVGLRAHHVLIRGVRALAVVVVVYETERSQLHLGGKAAEPEMFGEPRSRTAASRKGLRNSVVRPECVAQPGVRRASPTSSGQETVAPVGGYTARCGTRTVT